MTASVGRADTTAVTHRRVAGKIDAAADLMVSAAATGDRLLAVDALLLAAGLGAGDPAYRAGLLRWVTGELAKAEHELAQYRDQDGDGRRVAGGAGLIMNTKWQP